MKTPAILYCSIPWIVICFGMFYKTIAGGSAGQEFMTLAGLLWLVVSPAIMALGLMIAYREGQYSKGTVK